MKNQYTILTILLFLTIGIYAQTPEKINYQAVARDLSGNPLASQAIAVVIEVRQGSASGADVYKESHAVTTNAFGLFTLEIGGGTLLGGAFNTINWGTSSYYLYIEVDGNPIGASQLLSVPYALYAKKSLNGGAGNDTSIIDADGDTYINVEKTPDEDIIHFNLGNSKGYPAAEYFTMTGPRLEVLNSGESVFIGIGAGQNDNLATNQNVFIGKNSGNANTSGQYNSAIGQNSFQFNTIGSGNIAFGLNSLRNNVSGNTNVALGNGALRDHASGDNNTAIGFVALDVNTSGINNTSVGARTGFSNSSGSRNVFLGYEAGYFETGSDKLYIQNSSFSNPLIYGDFANDSLHINGILKINDGTQGANKILTSDAFGNASWQLPSAAGDNWGSQVVISSGSNISGNGTSGNPLIVTDSVNDADSDPNNERITTFALNTTSDSLVITEAGVRHSFPLSSLSDGDWTFGAGKIYNTTHLVGIGTTTPTEKLHIADGDPDLIVQDISGVGNTMRATIAFKDQVLGSVLDFGMKASGPTLTSHISGENISFQNNFGTGVSTRMIISGTNGYVGIGTSTPNSNLDISASGTQSQALNINFTSTASNGANNGIFSLVNNTAGGNIHSGYFQVQGSSSSTSSVAVKAFNTANSTLNAGIEATATGTGSTNYGVFSYASGATNNWAGYFGSGAPGDGKVYVQDYLSVGTTSTSSTVNIVGSLQFQDGNQGLNKVLTSDGAGNANWALPIASNILQDADGDTYIDVEQTTNEDIIHFSLAGTEHFRMDGAHLYVLNNGTSTFMGDNAGAVSTGAASTAFGFHSLQSATSGQHNTAIGANSMIALTTGLHNTAVGSQSLQNSSGSENVAIGWRSLLSVSSNENTAIGTAAMQQTTTGGFNTAIGYNAAFNNTTGGQNTAIGRYALLSNTTGTFNTALGYGADVSSPGLTNATAIGANTIVSQSNSIILGNNASVGIGTSTPAVKLDVSGNANILSTSGDPLVVRSSVDGFSFTVKESDNGFDAVRIFGYGTRGRLLMNNNGATAINFDANPTLDSYINAGDFGIGTTAPAAKLDVNGTFKLGITGNVNSKYLAGSVQPIISALTSSVSNNYRTITIPGAVVGDYVVITMAGGTVPQVVLTSASVVGANTVGLNLFNITGAAVPGGTYTFNYIIYK